jgi:hypothetical protein
MPMEEHEIVAAAKLFSIDADEEKVQDFIKAKFGTDFLYEGFLMELIKNVNIEFDLDSVDSDDTGPSCSIHEKHGFLEILLTDDGLMIGENSPRSGIVMAGIYAMDEYLEFIDVLNRIIASCKDSAEVPLAWHRKHTLPETY